MAKEVAISKRVKISEAQQYMLIAVLGASVILGIAISLTTHFVKMISFNNRVIAEEEKSIVAYSDVIKNIGVCKKPNGAIYSDGELDACIPDSIEISEIPDTLRSNILEDVASNAALNSVPKENTSSCINPDTNEGYTYKELNEIYSKSQGATELQAASQLIKSCSALRIIPDALPAFQNEEALLASLNKIFNVSNWSPESISPSGDTSEVETPAGLNPIAVNLTIEASPSTSMTVLNNIERSIREFNIENASIEWSGNQGLTINAVATAFYADQAAISETSTTITAEGN